MKKGIDFEAHVSDLGMMRYTFFVNPSEIAAAVPMSEHEGIIAGCNDEVLTILETLKRVHIWHKERS